MKSRRVDRFLVLLALICLAWAAPGKAQTGATFTILPRIQEAWTDTGALTEVITPSTNAKLTTSLDSMPLFGVTAQYTPPGWNTDFLLTGFYGTSSGQAQVVALVPTPLGTAGIGALGTYNTTRIDLEGIARYRMPSLPTYLMAGFRYIRLNFDISVPGIPIPATGTSALNGRFDSYNPELGVGGTAPLNPSGSLALFGNLIAGPSFQRIYILNRPGDDLFRTHVGPYFDLSVGVNYVITDHLNAALRYRATVVSLKGVTDFLITQGPEASVGYRF